LAPEAGGLLELDLFYCRNMLLPRLLPQRKRLIRREEAD
jgi:hypothetical protein